MRSAKIAGLLKVLAFAAMVASASGMTAKAADEMIEPGRAYSATWQLTQLLAGAQDKTLGNRLPDGLDTFLAKTSRQSAPYTDYHNWLGEKKQPSPEAVRLAMLGYRNSKSPTTTNEAFLEMLQMAQMQIRGGKQL